MRSIDFNPSKRAVATFERGKGWDCMEAVDAYPSFDSEARPDGLINLMGAQNKLMSDWMKSYLDGEAEASNSINALSYGSPSGSAALKSATAQFVNNQFNPDSCIEPDHIIATNGVTSAIDLLTWAICEPGDAVVYPVPNFYMLDFDLAARNGVVNIPVAVEQAMNGDPFASTEQAGKELEKAFAAAIDKATSKGLRCRVLFLCNPANPQGRCYAPATLKCLAMFCTKRGMHLVADEIYAMSNFSKGTEPFASVLSVPRASTADFQNVHSFYGLSKDFAMGGLRIGFVITKNKRLRDALNRMSFCTWISTSSDIFATRFLQRTDLVQDFINISQE